MSCRCTALLLLIIIHITFADCSNSAHVGISSDDMCHRTYADQYSEESGFSQD